MGRNQRKRARMDDFVAENRKRKTVSSSSEEEEEEGDENPFESASDDDDGASSDSSSNSDSDSDSDSDDSSGSDESSDGDGSGDSDGSSSASGEADSSNSSGSSDFDDSLEGIYQCHSCEAYPLYNRVYVAEEDGNIAYCSDCKDMGLHNMAHHTVHKADYVISAPMAASFTHSVLEDDRGAVAILSREFLDAFDAGKEKKAGQRFENLLSLVLHMLTEEDGREGSDDDEGDDDDGSGDDDGGDDSPDGRDEEDDEHDEDEDGESSSSADLD